MGIGLYISIDLPLYWYFLISWPFRMGSHWWQRSVQSSLFSLTVSNGGYICIFTRVNLPNLSSFLVLLLLHRALSFLIRNERPMNWHVLCTLLAQWYRTQLFYIFCPSHFIFTKVIQKYFIVTHSCHILYILFDLVKPRTCITCQCQYKHCSQLLS